MNTSFSRMAWGHRWWIIPVSLGVAMLLSIIPYPEWMGFAEPHWVSLVLFYWCLAVPERVGVGTGWIVGLLMDMMLHTLFGVYAFMLAFVAMVGVLFHRQVRMYPLWQQCMMIFAISALEVLFLAWVFRITNDIDLRLVYWQAALTTALVWPVVYTLLRFARRRSGMVQLR
ncbi:MAG: rod shape-determining protein MreD [Gammaproteobacteria bacterium]|nr:rod shape-determining protein MreD [Gammaproteobacteria bacterium]MYG65529.1 rod shape-determining protein MreD [Gammaproteobacteria bacterium]